MRQPATTICPHLVLFALVLAPLDAQTIEVFGDSITKAIGASAETRSWPHLLATATGSGYANHGVSGTTICWSCVPVPEGGTPAPGRTLVDLLREKDWSKAPRDWEESDGLHPNDEGNRVITEHLRTLFTR